MNNGSYAAEVQQRGIQFGGTQTGEGSQGLSWPSLTASWTASNLASFTLGSLYAAEGIWFEPSNQTAGLVDNFTLDSNSGLNTSL